MRSGRSPLFDNIALIPLQFLAALQGSRRRILFQVSESDWVIEDKALMAGFRGSEAFVFRIGFVSAVDPV
jgi:hypothetical protein